MHFFPFFYFSFSIFLFYNLLGYISKDFIPSSRPGLDPQCYNGARKSDNADKWFLDRKYPPFVKCPML